MPRGRLAMSHYISEDIMPTFLLDDERSRALCLIASLPYGLCVFSGKTAIYFGRSDSFDDNKGHLLLDNQPLAVGDKTPGALAALKREDIFVSESTWFYDGGECC